MSQRIYMDNHATTPVDPRVLKAMLPYFSERFGNAASGQHSYGWEAAEAVETARAQVARLLNADTRSIVFTSGATEATALTDPATVGPTAAATVRTTASGISAEGVSLSLCALPGL